MPQASPKPSQLNSGAKAKDPSSTREHPLPVHRCALAPWKTHLGPAVQKAKATADSRKEAGKTPASPSGAQRDLWGHAEPDASGQAWAMLAACARGSSDAPRMAAERKHLASWDGGCDVTKKLPLMPPRQHTGSRFSPHHISWALAARAGHRHGEVPYRSPPAPREHFAWRRSKRNPTGNRHLL